MISWWCTALEQPWSWAPIAYPGVWLAVAVPCYFYFRAVRAYPGATTTRQKWLFAGGMAVFWIASDWPIATLGAGYLASAHMLQFLLYTLGAAPLLMLGTPRWLARRILSRLRAYRTMRFFSRSLVVSAVTYNALLVASHAPGTVDLLRTSQWGSFFMDVVWLIAGIVLWMPVISPLPELRVDPLRAIGYLFATTSLVAVIPASLLTFSELPIYSIFELAPRIGSMTARADQQLAGIVMKLGSLPVIWSTIAVIWFRWARSERDLDVVEA